MFSPSFQDLKKIIQANFKEIIMEKWREYLIPYLLEDLKGKLREKWVCWRILRDKLREYWNCNYDQLSWIHVYIGGLSPHFVRDLSSGLEVDNSLELVIEWIFDCYLMEMML